MIANIFVNLLSGVLEEAPILDIPEGFEAAMTLFSSLVGYINIFVPLARLAPIFLLVVSIRNWNIIISVLRFILRFVPFMGG